VAFVCCFAAWLSVRVMTKHLFSIRSLEFGWVEGEVAALKCTQLREECLDGIAEALGMSHGPEC
jgi:hypothetical protein